MTRVVLDMVPGYAPEVDLLRHLGFFRAVADVRHFGNAAADLGMTQPPLSQGIRRLERHLGVRLFDRDARGVRITAAGQQLLPAARDLLDAADDLVAAARDLALPEQVRLGIAADLEDAVPVLLRDLAAGGTAVAPTVAGSVELVDLLRDGLLDVGVVRHPGVHDGLTAGEVLVLPTHLIGGLVNGGGSPLAQVTLPVAVPPRHHQPPAHDQLVDALRRAGHSGAVVEARDAAQRQALVAAGTAVGLVPVVDGAAETGCPPLRLRVVLPHVTRRRPEVDHDTVAAAIAAGLGATSAPPGPAR
ncbi:LysR family transcriptional regulator [Promicromonospora sp. NPDC057488]|uniref:LysR family transcriptional regulator n=1 Tax=Promicromonospora sp. NPDC057488 TaxID=3346147 RepID=UPI00366A74D7